MEMLHLKAEHKTIELVMGYLNNLSKDGHFVEIVDEIADKAEKKMILDALKQVQDGEVFEHQNLWGELLK